MKNVLNIVICVAVIAISASCAKRELNTKVSNVTGWNYYDKNTTNFEALEGNQMGAPDFVEIPHIPIGSKGKISVELTAPTEPGEYRSEWKLFGADNRFFGESLVAKIVVQ